MTGGDDPIVMTFRPLRAPVAEPEDDQQAMRQLQARVVG
jgi:hypothetical protein